MFNALYAMGVLAMSTYDLPNISTGKWYDRYTTRESRRKTLKNRRRNC